MQNGNGDIGHDIGPDEERHQNNGMYPVEVISNVHEGEYGMEVEYERVFVQRPVGGVFHEPMDNPTSSPRTARPATASKQFYKERERLKTFEKNWSEDYSVQPQDLARNGLFYIGPGDKVQCAFCQRTLRGWEPEDVVEDEHKRIYPDCPFVLGRCNGMNEPYNSAETMQHSYGVNMRTSVVQQQADQMKDMSQRLRTFDHRWPSSVEVEPRLIAEAGLFFIGDRDKTRCFMCNKVIQGWEAGDDPWMEHARLYPQCQYVLSVKGKEFVEQASNPRSLLSTASSPSQPSSSNIAVQNATQQSLPSQASENASLTNQMSRLQIDEDMNSPAVKAFQEMFSNVPDEAIRREIDKIRLSKGSSYKLSSRDFEHLT